jgi:hypothetical protein
MDGAENRKFGNEVRRLMLGRSIVCQRFTGGDWETFWQTDVADENSDALSAFACRIMQRKLAGLPVLRERVGDA